MDVKCEVKFIDNPLGIYYAGQEVKGSVELELEKPKKFRAISVTLHGCARVNWEQVVPYKLLGHSNSLATKNYTNSEEYITKHKYIAGPCDGSETPELPAGTHKFNFAFELTDNLPCSFEGKHGYIRYTVKAILERPWKYDLKYRLTFTVLKEANLNYDSPDLRLPLRLDTTKNFCLWPCLSQPLRCSVTIPISGFVPGQVIPISVVVDNTSAIEVEKIKFKLKKVITYHAEHPEFKVKREKFVIASKESDGVPPHEKRWRQHKIKIPAGPPTNNGYCKAIGIGYLLDVIVVTPQMHQNQKIRLPITIGTIPIAVENIFSVQSLNLLAGNESAESTSQITPTQTENLPPAYNDIVPVLETQTASDPPSYEAAMDTQAGIQDAPEEHEYAINPIDYTPRYPVYRFNIVEVINASKQSMNESTETVTTTSL